MSVAMQSEHTCVHFVVRPDRSMSAHGLSLVCAAMTTGLLVIGLTAQIVAGAFPILAFSVVEAAALAWGFNCSYRQGRQRETISIDPDQVFVEFGNDGPTQHWRFQTHWLQIVLTPDRQANQLFLRSHGQAVEIGTFLSEPDRRLLARQLVAALAPYSSIYATNRLPLPS